MSAAREWALRRAEFWVGVGPLTVAVVALIVPTIIQRNSAHSLHPHGVQQALLGPGLNEIGLEFLKPDSATSERELFEAH